ncbi:MAG: sugar MFS transporter [Cyclobacteriaceae bacterium]
MGEPTQAHNQQVDQKTNYFAPLVFLTLLFLMWGFITSMNDILIPHFQNEFQLTHVQAMLIQFCFFGAYFIISTIYFVFSIRTGDLISKIGYKKGIVLGLIIMAVGCLLFYPAAEFKTYALFLSALFILASGMALLQIAANPYVALLGKPENAAGRLNLTQAVNSFGTTVGPAIGAYFIFSPENGLGDMGIKSVQFPYLLLAGILGALAVVFVFARLPRIVADNTIVKGMGAIKHRHLVLGALCIFMYVGGEVTIGSTLIRFLNLDQIAGLSDSEASKYLSFYWGGLMVGRFFGAIALSEGSNGYMKNIGFAVVVAASFLAVYLLAGWETSLIWSGLVVFNMLAFFAGGYKPARTLGLFAAIVIALIVAALASTGVVAMWAIISVGLFNSIMWSNIFTLAIKDLGKYTSQGSSVLIMAILGAAVVPLFQGLVADYSGIHLSFIVPLLCYLYVLYYGFYGYKVKDGNADTVDL